MELIAQASPTAPPDHNAWLTNLTFFLVVVNLLWTVTARMLGRSERRDVKILGEFVPKGEFDQFKQENNHAHETFTQKLEGAERVMNGRLEEKLDAMRLQIAEDVKEANRHGDERTRSLHKRINPIEAQIEAVKTSLTHTHNQLAHIETKLDRFLERNSA